MVTVFFNGSGSLAFAGVESLDSCLEDSYFEELLLELLFDEDDDLDDDDIFYITVN
jgi:hypothetical protein